MKICNCWWYLLYLLPWFLSGVLVRSDANYYFSLNLPFFAPPAFLFGVVWTILYFLIAYSICGVFRNSSANYKIYLVINYLANQLFTFCFFILRDNFLAFVDALIVLISSLYLFLETKVLDERYSKYLLPYIFWNIFALLLSFCIFWMN